MPSVTNSDDGQTICLPNSPLEGWEEDPEEELICGSIENIRRLDFRSQCYRITGLVVDIRNGCDDLLNSLRKFLQLFNHRLDFFVDFLIFSNTSFSFANS